MAALVTAKQMALISCHRCDLLCEKPVGKGRCPRCGALLHSRKPNSLGRTWALVLAALIFYIPANTLPITHTSTLGTIQSDTIMSGVMFFLYSGSWGIALIIFIASVFVPLLKLLLLIMLMLSVQFKWQWRPVDRTRLYRFTEFIGRWSMLDIFVVTILVALVQLGSLAHMEAGAAALYFAAVVVITMCAAETFDPRLIWDNLEDRHDPADQSTSR